MRKSRMGSMITAPIAPALEREVSAGDNHRKFPRERTVSSCTFRDRVVIMNRSWEAVQERQSCNDEMGVIMNKSWKAVQGLTLMV